MPEPAACTIDDLARYGRTAWEGVRNCQARNFLRGDMQVGDRVLSYAFNANPSGVATLAAIPARMASRYAETATSAGLAA